MSGTALATKATSGVIVTAYGILVAVALLTAAAVCIVGARPVRALPSYARQTGQQCAACHNGFPELTPYGRQFKLRGGNRQQKPCPILGGRAFESQSWRRVGARLRLCLG
jgi:hypothetical protein